MGSRGPVPKSNEQRIRRNKESRLQEVSVIAPSPAAQPDGKKSWHPTAKMIWEAMGTSAQSRFYQPTDWAVGYFLCDVVTAFEEAGCVNGQMVSSILSGCSSLMLTEGERRRVGIELTRLSEDETDKKTEVAAKWQTKLG